MAKYNTPEKALEKSIMQWLELQGDRILATTINCGHIKTANGGLFRATSRNGVPDIEVIYKGRYIGLECKAGKNKQSSHQIEFERRCISAGGIYKVVYSLDEVIEFFDMI